jgi:HAD superfamily hydrolase (TIGR01549 family)
MSDPTPHVAVEAVLFDFSHTLFRPETGADWVRHAGAMAGAELDADETARIAAEIERLLAAPERAESQVGRDRSAEAHRAAIGSVLEAIETTVEGLSEALYERLIAPDAWVPYVDSEPVLRALKAGERKVGVVSNIGWDIRESFRHHGLDAFIDSYTLSFEHGVEKPDPELFTAACRALGVDAAAAVMVGDNPVADGGAVRVGIAAYVLPGAASNGRAATWGADSGSDTRGLERVLNLAGVRPSR